MFAHPSERQHNSSTTDFEAISALLSGRLLVDNHISIYSDFHSFPLTKQHPLLFGFWRLNRRSRLHSVSDWEPPVTET